MSSMVTEILRIVTSVCCIKELKYGFYSDSPPLFLSFFPERNESLMLVLYKSHQNSVWVCGILDIIKMSYIFIYILILFINILIFFIQHELSILPFKWYSINYPTFTIWMISILFLVLSGTFGFPSAVLIELKSFLNYLFI